MPSSAGYLLLEIGCLHCGAATQVLGVYEREEDAIAEVERRIEAMEDSAESIWQYPSGWEFMTDNGLHALDIQPLPTS